MVDDYKPFTVLDYADARDLMYGEIYNVNDSVSCVYTDHTLYLPSNVDPSSHLYMNASANGINAEHTYPRSKGAAEEYGNGFSDLHHLFPSRTGVNAARSNFPFLDIDDNQTTEWYFNTLIGMSIPNSNIDQYSERINGVFEPREDHKGNVARAMFYFYSMYEDACLDADPDFFELQRETLCEWHNQDPVDQIEWERTYEIAQYQNNRPNPFVIDCSLAQRTYCEATPIDCPTLPLYTSVEILPNTPNLKIYPNPVTDRISIEKDGLNLVRFIDVTGKTVLTRSFYNTARIDFYKYPKGIYFVIINNSDIQAKIVK